MTEIHLRTKLKNIYMSTKYPPPSKSGIQLKMTRFNKKMGPMRNKINQLKLLLIWEFPGRPVVGTPCSPCGGPGFDPWSGTKIPQATWHVWKKIFF